MEVVEHVVLFRSVQGASPTEIESWASGLRGLRNLQGVIHLHVGCLLSCKPNDGDWTHALYARYKDKDSLQAYAVHPDHIRAVSRGKPLFSDVMALDWAGGVEAPTMPGSMGEQTLPVSSSVSASVSSFPSWIAFLRWAPGTSQELISKLLSTLCSSARPSLLSFGPNFSPDRARDFEWGFAMFPPAHDGDDDKGFGNNVLSLHRSMRRPEVEKFLLVQFSPMHGPVASM